MRIERKWEREGGEGVDETDLMVFTPPTHPLLSKVKTESFDSKEARQGASYTPPTPIITPSSHPINLNVTQESLCVSLGRV